MDELTPKDSRFLQKFLDSETGQKLKQAVKSLEPVMDSETIEGRAMQAAEYSQYLKMIQFIKNQAVVVPEKKEKQTMIDMTGLDVREI